MIKGRSIHRLALAVVLIASPLPAAVEIERVVLAGDSTVASDGGWGDDFAKLLKPGVECVNLARGGRSSKSYRAEGWWTQVLAAKPSWVFIQFGHNDEPGKGADRETDPDTTFRENLIRYVEEARAVGANPVLVTPLTRREFNGGVIAANLTPYVAAVKKVAAERDVPLLDLHTRAIEQLETLGPEAAKAFDRVREGDDPKVPDTTHLSPAGAAATAVLVASELGRKAPGFVPLLNAPTMTASDIEYGTAGGEILRLDAAVPPGEGPFPIAILIHGGGWGSGDKRRDFDALFTPLTDAGIVWFSISYRFAPEHRWPAGFDDVLTAIRWVRKHAADYNGDPRRIALIGYSAGGQLATLAAIRADESARVQAVVGLAPAVDLVADSQRRGQVSLSLQHLLDLPEALDDRALDRIAGISPALEVKPNLPPFLLVQGTADQSVLHAHTVAFAAKLKAAEVPCELIEMQGGVHRIADWRNHSPDYPEKIVKWLSTTLGRGAGG